MIGPSGKRFTREAQNADRQLFAWTVNEGRWMEWCIRENLESKAVAEIKPEQDGGTPSHCALVDGVITDDPKLYLQVCQRYEDELDGKTTRKAMRLADKAREGIDFVKEMVLMQLLVVIFFTVRRLQGKLDYFHDRKTLERL